jgi:hypothetical protein
MTLKKFTFELMCYPEYRRFSHVKYYPSLGLNFLIFRGA